MARKRSSNIFSYKADSLLLPTLLLLIGGTAYGSVFAANKLVIEEGFPFIAYTFWQAGLAALFYLIITTLLKAPPKINIVYVRQYAVTSVLGIVVPVLMLTYVAGKLPAGVITLVIALTPALTYIFAYLIRIEHRRWSSIGGVVFGLAGVLLIVLPEQGLPHPSMVGWVLASLIVPLTFATNNIFIALTRPVEASSHTLTCGLLLTATIVILPIMLIEEGFYAFWEAPNIALWGLIWAAAVQAFVIYCLFEIIRRTGPVFFAQFNYVIVITGFLWSLALFNENLSLWVWAALGVMIIGLALTHIGTAQAMREN